MFVDTLPFSYYDMLVLNAFVGFGDLIYFERRIEDGIRRGKIMDTRPSILEKKRIIFVEHVQAMSREKGSKRKSYMMRDEPVKNFPHSSSYTRVPMADLPSPKKFAPKRGRDFDSSYS